MLATCQHSLELEVAIDLARHPQLPALRSMLLKQCKAVGD